ncbi:hypothetical protein PR048_030586 [Dryococelus australis]|uniref:Uncharacterized protein n=1 Tax=Dryococelus australis TaxID=614101 RepID=A0ABQ9G9D6_9NEOP|nr:hypothetical protein PR048_030586 [Dryococelus australis]
MNDKKAVRLLASHQDNPGSIPGRVTPDICKLESCLTMPLVGGFSRLSPVSSTLALQRCSIFTSIHPHRLSRHHYFKPSKSLSSTQSFQTGWRCKLRNRSQACQQHRQIIWVRRAGCVTTTQMAEVRHNNSSFTKTAGKSRTESSDVRPKSQVLATMDHEKIHGRLGTMREGEGPRELWEGDERNRLEIAGPDCTLLWGGTVRRGGEISLWLCQVRTNHPVDSGLCTPLEFQLEYYDKSLIQTPVKTNRVMQAFRNTRYIVWYSPDIIVLQTKHLLMSAVDKATQHLFRCHSQRTVQIKVLYRPKIIYTCVMYTFVYTRSEWVKARAPGISTHPPPTQTVFDSRQGSTGRCHMSVGFLGDLPFPPNLHSGAVPYSPRFTLIGSQDLADDKEMGNGDLHRREFSQGSETQRFLTHVSIKSNVRTGASLQSVLGATVSERLDCSPPIEANMDQSRPGHSQIFASRNHAGRCRRSAGFLGVLPFPLPLHSGAPPFSLHSTLISSIDLVVKSRPNLSIQLKPLDHTVFDTSRKMLAQPSPPTVIAENLCAVDINMFVNNTVESKPAARLGGEQTRLESEKVPLLSLRKCIMSLQLLYNLMTRLRPHSLPEVEGGRDRLGRLRKREAEGKKKERGERKASFYPLAPSLTLSLSPRARQKFHFGVCYLARNSFSDMPGSGGGDTTRRVVRRRWRDLAAGRRTSAPPPVRARWGAFRKRAPGGRRVDPARGSVLATVIRRPRSQKQLLTSCYRKREDKMTVNSFCSLYRQFQQRVVNKLFPSVNVVFITIYNTTLTPILNIHDSRADTRGTGQLKSSNHESAYEQKSYGVQLALKSFREVHLSLYISCNGEIKKALPPIRILGFMVHFYQCNISKSTYVNHERWTRKGITRTTRRNNRACLDSSTVVITEIPPQSLSPRFLHSRYHRDSSTVVITEIPPQSLSPRFLHSRYHRDSSTVVINEFPPQSLSPRFLHSRYQRDSSTVVITEIPPQSLSPRFLHSRYHRDSKTSKPFLAKLMTLDSTVLRTNMVLLTAHWLSAVAEDGDDWASVLQEVSNTAWTNGYSHINTRVLNSILSQNESANCSGIYVYVTDAVVAVLKCRTRVWQYLVSKLIVVDTSTAIVNIAFSHQVFYYRAVVTSLGTRFFIAAARKAQENSTA